MDLIEKTQATILKHSMLAKGNSVLVALSGGPDSVCLTVALKRLSAALGLTHLGAAYIDHGLRPHETPGEIEFCRDLCKRFDLEFMTTPIDVQGYMQEQGMSLQDAARTLRYRALDILAREKGYSHIATAHNLDDQCETFFLRILRGSGPRGLASIPPTRQGIIRPLIEIERPVIEAFLDKEGLGYVTDSSNRKTDYMRNRFRADVMPLLKELNPNLQHTVARTIEILNEEERFFMVAVTKKLITLICRKTPTSMELFAIPFESMDRALARRVLRRAMEDIRGLRRISFAHVEETLELIMRGTPGQSLDLPHGIRIIRKYSTFLITATPPPALGTYTLVPGQSRHLKEIGKTLKTTLLSTVNISGAQDRPDARWRCLLDADKVGEALVIRSRRAGDYFHPSGFGHKKKLQDFMVDEKVPRFERNAVPVLAAKEDIIWIAGYRADERYMPGEETKRYLMLEIIDDETKGGQA